ncbi:MAG: hypothetical protein LBV00_11955 [Propionibacteriaceae bacterium]|jgi:hypothetical protein|nr:hypothetical protein [Propionibacteriaceae bacterium]
MTPTPTPAIARLAEEVLDLLQRGEPASRIPDWFGTTHTKLATRLFDGHARDVAIALQRALQAEIRQDAIAVRERRAEAARQALIDMRQRDTQAASLVQAIAEDARRLHNHQTQLARLLDTRLQPIAVTL